MQQGDKGAVLFLDLILVNFVLYSFISSIFLRIPIPENPPITLATVIIRINNIPSKHLQVIYTMSAQRETGSAAPSVQKWVIKEEVENELRSGALKSRLLDKSLSHGSVELFLKCPNLTEIGSIVYQPFCLCTSLLRIDLYGCRNLESIPKVTFAGCEHLVSVVFGEHSNATNLGGVHTLILSRTRRLQQKPQCYRPMRIPRLLQARRCPACIQFDFFRL